VAGDPLGDYSGLDGIFRRIGIVTLPNPAGAVGGDFEKCFWDESMQVRGMLVAAPGNGFSSIFADCGGITGFLAMPDYEPGFDIPVEGRFVESAVLISKSKRNDEMKVESAIPWCQFHGSSKVRISSGRASNSSVPFEFSCSLLTILQSISCIFNSIRSRQRSGLIWKPLAFALKWF
jgi:hypothetical protein